MLPSFLIALMYCHLSLCVLPLCLVVTDLSVKCARYSEKAFNIDLMASCSTIFMGHNYYIYTIVSPFPYLYYLAGCLCGCVRYTPLVIYFHTEALMLMSDDAISDLLCFLKLACSRISGFRSCLVALSRIFIRSVFSYPIYAFQHFITFLGLGLCAGSPH